MKIGSNIRPTLLAVGLAVLWASGSSAHEGHHHNAMGTIAAVHQEQLDLTAKDGKVESFRLTASTVYKRGDAAAKREDLKVGERAVVMYEVKEGKSVAIEVKLGTSAPASGGGA